VNSRLELNVRANETDLGTPAQRRMLQQVRPIAARFADGVPASVVDLCRNLSKHGPMTPDELFQYRAFVAVRLYVKVDAMLREHRKAAAAETKRARGADRQQLVFDYVEKHEAVGEPLPKQEAGCLEAKVSLRTYKRALSNWRRLKNRE
jgi:hypothetical protein